MTPAFSVRTTSHFDRLLKSLVKQHPGLTKHYAEAIRILRTDPYNRSRAYDITKLEGVKPGEGQYRLRLGRWCFRYDIEGEEVIFQYCGLRRESTY